jgi:hypothetical protein
MSTTEHVWPTLADGTKQRSGHDLDAECRCRPELWVANGGVVYRHQLLWPDWPRVCPACGRDVDRDPWPHHGILCGHCDEYTQGQR